MESLFQAGRPVMGNKLIGRKEILKEIIHYLNSGQSVVLIAPRRFGKTSVVLEVLNRFKKDDLFTAYVDIFAAPEKRIFAEQITEAVLSNKKLHKAFSDFRKSFSSLMHQMEFKQAVEDFEFILKFADKNQDELDLLSESVDFIEEFASKYKKQIICGFDEFGDIEKLWEELSGAREQVNILIAIAQGVPSLYNSLDLNKLNVSRALRKLRSKGHIKKEDKINVLVDPMLKYFIRKEIFKWDSPQSIS